MPAFSRSSLDELGTAAYDLQRLFNEVIKHWDCKVIQGRRTQAEHDEQLRTGKSKTQNSKHVTGNTPSNAVDVSPYPIDWKDTGRFYAFSGFVIGVASQMGIKIRWGGDWDSDRDLKDQTFNDLVHFELVD